jgi:hypothetical protein
LCSVVLIIHPVFTHNLYPKYRILKSVLPSKGDSVQGKL